ncbi:hypothetical protein F5Y09DRAFT_341129 [Xylaria sp. FL1042]|nr:hypothetical protein F5Y09DRAFT_341129 [Xylaria sp. FL1042]
MCINESQYFTKCGHVAKKLATCPTYHKQRSKGFLGCLFGGRPKSNDCGKVVPNRLRSEGYCQACLVKKDDLRAHELGQGALRVQRKDYEEIIRGGARRGPEKSHHHRDGAYARKAESRHPRGSPKQEYHRKGAAREPERKGEWMPAYGHNPPMKKPAARSPSRKPMGHFTPPPGPPPPRPPRSPPRHSNQSSAARAEAAGHRKPVRAGLRVVEARQRGGQRGRAPTPGANRTGRWRTESPTRWEAAVSNLVEKAKVIAHPKDDSDDASFACQTSRWISNREPKPMPNKRERQRLHKEHTLTRVVS